MNLFSQFQGMVHVYVCLHVCLCVCGERDPLSLAFDILLAKISQPLASSFHVRIFLVPLSFFRSNILRLQFITIEVHTRSAHKTFYIFAKSLKSSNMLCAIKKIWNDFNRHTCASTKRLGLNECRGKGIGSERMNGVIFNNSYLSRERKFLFLLYFMIANDG